MNIAGQRSIYDIENETRIGAALQIAQDWGRYEGAHHKQWVLDQMVRALIGDDDAHYQSFRHYAGLWDEGQAP